MTVPKTFPVPANLTLPAATKIDQGLVMVTDPPVVGALSTYKVAASVTVTVLASVMVGW